MEEYDRNLFVTNQLREPVIVRAIDSFHLEPGSQGLDAGCGVGHQVCLLAKGVGQPGRVTGLDVSSEILSYARELVIDSGLEDRVSLRQGDVNHLPFEDHTFDWAWSMDCVGYLPQDPLPALGELKRVVRPGGRVAILAWTSQMLLPGYPQLEARLNATSMGLAPFARGEAPQRHFLRALGWFQALGFSHLSARIFAGSAYAPMSREIREGVDAILSMRWQGAEDELTAEDSELFQRLCRPDSDDYIANEPDYAMFFTYSMFSGVVV